MELSLTFEAQHRHGMLTALMRGSRFRVAIWLAAAAVFAFVAPPIAVALAPTGNAVYCLTHGDHAIGHDEQDQAAGHQHPGDLGQVKHLHGNGDSKSHCCGLFCVTALAPSLGYIFDDTWFDAPAFFSLQTNFSGRTPDRLDRPPIPRLSI
jgi:hypothetical protein